MMIRNVAQRTMRVSMTMVQSAKFSMKSGLPKGDEGVPVHLLSKEQRGTLFENRGNPFEAIPEEEQDSYGRRLEEVMTAKDYGKERYNLHQLEGEFGSLDNPKMVPSAFPSRIVGCVGSGDRVHDVVWFDCEFGPKHMCTSCGQIFQLTRPIYINVDQDIEDVAPVTAKDKLAAAEKLIALKQKTMTEENLKNEVLAEGRYFEFKKIVNMNLVKFAKEEDYDYTYIEPLAKHPMDIVTEELQAQMELDAKEKKAAQAK